MQHTSVLGKCCRAGQTPAVLGCVFVAICLLLSCSRLPTETNRKIAKAHNELYVEIDVVSGKLLVILLEKCKAVSNQNRSSQSARALQEGAPSLLLAQESSIPYERTRLSDYAISITYADAAFRIVISCRTVQGIPLPTEIVREPEDPSAGTYKISTIERMSMEEWHSHYGSQVIALEKKSR